MKFPCPDCGQKIDVDDFWAGRSIACPFCQKTILAPDRSCAEEPVPKTERLASPAGPSIFLTPLRIAMICVAVFVLLTGVSTTAWYYGLYRPNVRRIEQERRESQQRQEVLRVEKTRLEVEDKHEEEEAARLRAEKGRKQKEAEAGKKAADAAERDRLKAAEAARAAEESEQQRAEAERKVREIESQAEKFAAELAELQSRAKKRPWELAPSSGDGKESLLICEKDCPLSSGPTVLASVPIGTQLTWSSQQGGFAAVIYDGQSGWVPVSKCIMLDASPPCGEIWFCRGLEEIGRNALKEGYRSLLAATALDPQEALYRDFVDCLRSLFTSIGKLKEQIAQAEKLKTDFAEKVEKAKFFNNVVGNRSFGTDTGVDTVGAVQAKQASDSIDTCLEQQQKTVQQISSALRDTQKLVGQTQKKMASHASDGKLHLAICLSEIEKQGVKLLEQCRDLDRETQILSRSLPQKSSGASLDGDGNLAGSGDVTGSSRNVKTPGLSDETKTLPADDRAIDALREKLSESRKCYDGALAALAKGDLVRGRELLADALEKWPANKLALLAKNSLMASSSRGILSALDEIDAMERDRRFTEARAIVKGIRKLCPDVGLWAEMEKDLAAKEQERTEDYEKARQLEDALNLGEAIKLYRKCGYPADAKRVTGLLGEVLEKDRKYEEAVACYEEAGRMEDSKRLRRRYGITGGVAVAGREVDAPDIYEENKGRVCIVCVDGMSFGTGFLVSKRGYVVTNQHVVGDHPSSIMVRFPGGTEGVSAKLVKLQNPPDLALLKVDPLQLRGVTPCQLAKGVKQNKVGQKVYALGFSENLFETPDFKSSGWVKNALEACFTDGTINNMNRTLGGNACIQMTAPINRGNSGGPLFNNQGLVIGVNTFGLTEKLEENAFCAIKIDEVWKHFGSDLEK